MDRLAYASTQCPLDTSKVPLLCFTDGGARPRLLASCAPFPSSSAQGPTIGTTAGHATTNDFHRPNPSR
jgi:hypothetical protein